MLCPFHLDDVTFRKEQETGRSTFVYLCPDCKEQVPPLYVRDYRQYPPVVVSAIGSRGHGKTVYFAALFDTLRQRSPAHYWPRFFTMGLSEQVWKRSTAASGCWRTVNYRMVIPRTSRDRPWFGWKVCPCSGTVHYYAMTPLGSVLRGQLN